VNPRDDVGVVMLGTLTKVLLVLAVVGTAGYDTVSITTTQLTVRDDAQAAAELGHEALRDRGTPQAAYAAVVKYAKAHGEAVVAKSFTVGSNNTVTVTLRRDAHTIAAEYVPKVSTYVVATATATASDPAR
jgi:hypothetical protein